MSRRYSRQKSRKSLTISEEDHAKYVELAQSSKLDMGFVAGYLADLALKYDLFSVGWEDRMNATITSVEGLEYLTADNKCTKLSWDETNWLCVTLRTNRDPMVKKLGKTIQQMNGRCTPCKTQRWAEADRIHGGRLETQRKYGANRWGGLEGVWDTRLKSLLERGPAEEMREQWEGERAHFLISVGLPP